MTITRDGKTYTLTPDELYNAFVEQRKLFDIDNVEYEAEDDKYTEAQGDYILKHAKEAAYLLRCNIDKYDMEFEYAMDAAIKDVLNNFKESEGE